MVNERRVNFDPDHPKANIHGVVGIEGEAVCYTDASAKTLCTGCCTALHIIPEEVDPDKLNDLDHDYIALKPRGENCHAQIPSQGCNYIIEGTPEGRYWICPLYHCSGDIIKAKQIKDENMQKNPLANLDKYHEIIAAGHRIQQELDAALKHNEITQEEYDESIKRFNESVNPNSK